MSSKHAESWQDMRGRTFRPSPQPTTPEECIRAALANLVDARELLKAAGAPKSVQRVRLALTSAQGALRHARLAPFRAARRRTKAAGGAP